MRLALFTRGLEDEMNLERVHHHRILFPTYLSRHCWRKNGKIQLLFLSPSEGLSINPKLYSTNGSKVPNPKDFHMLEKPFNLDYFLL